MKKGARLKRDVNSSENHLITTHLLKTRKKSTNSEFWQRWRNWIRVRRRRLRVPPSIHGFEKGELITCYTQIFCGQIRDWDERQRKEKRRREYTYVNCAVKVGRCELRDCTEILRWISVEKRRRTSHFETGRMKYIERRRVEGRQERYWEWKVRKRTWEFSIYGPACGDDEEPEGWVIEDAYLRKRCKSQKAE